MNNSRRKDRTRFKLKKVLFSLISLFFFNVLPYFDISKIFFNIWPYFDTSKLILSAKKNGADAVKFQIWNPKNLKKGPWDKDGRRELYEKSYLNKKIIIKLIFI